MVAMYAQNADGKIADGHRDPCVYCNETLTLENVHDGKSRKDQRFEYHTGTQLRIIDYDYDHDEGCSNGIHFFESAKQTLDYAYSTRGMGWVSNRMTAVKYMMFTTFGAELLDPWMEESVKAFKNGAGKDIYEELREGNDHDQH